VRAALREVQDKLEYAYVVTGPYGDFPFYIGRSPDPKVGTFDVPAKRAVLLGDGNGRISLSSRPEYVSLFSLSTSAAAVTPALCSSC
jgi:hypothetical protein